MALSISNITKIFNTGFIRTEPNATSKKEIPWSTFASSLQSSGQFADTIDDNTLHREFIQVLEEMFKSRDAYYKAVESIQYSDKTLEILDQLIDEVLNAVSATRPFTPAVKEGVPNALNIMKECEDFNNRCNVYRYDRDMMRRLILFGEVFLGTTVVAGKGIVELNDTIEGKNILPLYKGYELQEYINLPKSQNSGYDLNKPLRIDHNLLTHFTVSPNRFVLKPEHDTSVFNKGLSVLAGVSVLYPTIGKLYRLQNLENASDLQALAQASAEQLIGVPVGDSVKPTDYPEIARTYMDFLRPVFGNQSSSNTQSLTQTYNVNTGKFKILPFTQGQGKPEAISFDKPDLSILENKVTALADSIDKALGTNDADGSRAQIYANRSRLVRRLMDILEARRLGWKEIYLRNLTFKGIWVDPADFDVQMVALPDYEVFVEAESLSNLLESLRNSFNFAREALDSGFIKSVNGDCLVNLFETFAGNRFNTLKGLLEAKEHTYADGEEPGEMSGMSSFSGGGSSLDLDMPPSHDDIDVKELSNEPEADVETPEVETPQPEIEQ